MKRIKSVNGYTIYEATSQRDTDNYGCEVGSYNIYLSSDIRDFGLTNSYPEYDNVDSLTYAIVICNGSRYAVACALADELSDLTYQDMDLVLEIERRLDAGDAVNTIRQCYDRENGILYESISDAIDHGFDPYANDEFDPYEDHPAMAYDEAGKLHVVEDECEWDEDLCDGDLEDVFEAAILDAEVKDNPYAPYGGPDHLGETVREFIESSGTTISTLDELNAALTECGCMPISTEPTDVSYTYHTCYNGMLLYVVERNGKIVYEGFSVDEIIERFGFNPNCYFEDELIYPESAAVSFPTINPGDYLLDPYGGIVRIRAVHRHHIDVEYPSGKRSNNWPLVSLDFSVLSIINSDSSRNLRESAWSAWTELDGQDCELLNH